MRFARRPYRKLVLGLTILCVVVFSTGCFKGKPGPTRASTAGVILEDLLPENPFIAASFNPTDEEERARLDALATIVLKDKKEKLFASFTEYLGEEVQEKVTPQEINDIFGKDFRFALGIGSVVKENDDPVVDVVIALKNPELARTVLKRLEDQRSARVVQESADVFYMTYDDPDGDEALIIKDVLYVTNGGATAAQAAIKRYQEKGKGSLSQFNAFTESFKEMDSPLTGYLFIGPAAWNSKLLNPNGSTSTVNAQMLTMRAEKDGFKFDMILEGNKEAVKEKNAQGLFDSYSPELYKKVPGTGALVFVETHNLGDVIDQQMKAMNSSVDSLKLVTGIDFKQQVYPFINKGFAFVLQNLGAVIPSASLYFDASDAPQKAQELLKAADMNIDAGLAMLNSMFAPSTTTTATQSPVFERSALTADNLQGTLVKMHLDRMPADVATAPFMKSLQGPLEISYGITKDNLFFISTIPNIAQALKDPATIEENALFKEMRSRLEYFESISFIDGVAIAQFGDLIINTIKRLDPTAEPLDEAALKVLREHFLPIKGYTQFSENKGYTTHGNAFLKIQ